MLTQVVLETAPAGAIELILVGLYVALAVLLVRTYRRTRNIGFIWLAVATILWPAVSTALGWIEAILSSRVPHYRLLPFPLDMQIREFIDVGLLLVAALYFAKAKCSTPL